MEIMIVSGGHIVADNFQTRAIHPELAGTMEVHSYDDVRGLWRDVGNDFVFGPVGGAGDASAQHVIRSVSAPLVIINAKGQTGPVGHVAGFDIGRESQSLAEKWFEVIDINAA